MTSFIDFKLFSVTHTNSPTITKLHSHRTHTTQHTFRFREKNEDVLVLVEKMSKKAQRRKELTDPNPTTPRYTLGYDANTVNIFVSTSRREKSVV